jgi:hypothetical protein
MSQPVEFAEGDGVTDADPKGLRIGFAEHEFIIRVRDGAVHGVDLSLWEVRGRTRHRGGSGLNGDEGGLGELGGLDPVDLGRGLAHGFGERGRLIGCGRIVGFVRGDRDVGAGPFGLDLVAQGVAEGLGEQERRDDEGH